MKFVLGVKIPVYGSTEDVTVNKPDEIHGFLVELYYTVNMKASGIVSHMRCPQKRFFEVEIGLVPISWSQTKCQWYFTPWVFLPEAYSPVIYIIYFLSIFT